MLDFPKEASKETMHWTNDFFFFGVREHSGMNVIRQLCYSDNAIVASDEVVFFRML